jgi:hypothetical protein
MINAGCGFESQGARHAVRANAPGRIANYKLQSLTPFDCARSTVLTPFDCAQVT